MRAIRKKLHATIRDKRMANFWRRFDMLASHEARMLVVGQPFGTCDKYARRESRLLCIAVPRPPARTDLDAVRIATAWAVPMQPIVLSAAKDSR